MIKSQVVGTIQYIEWLILIDRGQPSLIAGVSVFRPLWLGEEIAKYEQMELASNRDGRDIRCLSRHFDTSL